jgi:hypothetical protein
MEDERLGDAGAFPRQQTVYLCEALRLEKRIIIKEEKDRAIRRLRAQVTRTPITPVKTSKDQTSLLSQF